MSSDASKNDDVTVYDLIRILSKTEVPSERLEKFVEGRFGWKALTPADQHWMAIEILRWRQHR